MTCRSIARLFAVAFVAVCGMAQAQTWRPAAETETEAYLVDIKSIIDVDGKKMASVLVTGHEGQPLADYGSRLQLIIFDCAGNKLALKEYALFARPGAQGKLLTSGTYADSELEYSKPGNASVGEKLLSFVCQP